MASFALRRCVSDAAGEFSEQHRKVWCTLKVMSGKPLHLAVWSEWGCFIEPQVNVCLCAWHWTVACVEEQVALSVFQCCSSMDPKDPCMCMCFNVIYVTEVWNALLWVFCEVSLNACTKPINNLDANVGQSLAHWTLNSSFFIPHLFFTLTTSRTQRGFQNFIKMWNEKHF